MKTESKLAIPWIVSPSIHEISLEGWRFQKPVVNVNKCCQCGQCYLYCPTGCITYRNSYFEANLDYCKGCGICSHVCSISAITMEMES